MGRHPTPGSALAPNPRPVGDFGERGDVSADPNRTGCAEMEGISRPVPNTRCPSVCAPRRGHRVVGGLGLQPARSAIARLCCAARRPPRWGFARPAGRSARLARDRALHGTCGAGVRLRARCRCGRHQRRASSCPPRRVVVVGRSGPSTRRRSRARGPGLAMEPDHSRLRCVGMHEAKPNV